MTIRLNLFLVTLAATVLASLAIPVSAAGPGPAVTDPLLQQELKQTQIRNSTQRVADQLATVIAEFDRNQIAGEDVKVLKAVRNVLDALSEKDMQVVIQYLQQARSSSDPSASTQSVTEAYAKQNAILTQLRQLIAEYERQHRLYLLSVRFRELARKQTETMRTAARLARATENKLLKAFNDEQKNTLRLQQIEQDAIRPEVVVAVSQLDKLAREITDGPTAERPKLALKQVKDGALVPTLDSANENLTKGLLGSATSDQLRARNEMREIARLLILSEDQVEALRQALHEIEQAIDQQRAVITQTAAIESKEAAVEAETHQAEVVDNADLIRKDVDSLAPVAAEHLKTAFNDMQDAREALTSGDPPAKRSERALPKQEAALAGLEQGRRALQDQLARAEQLATRPENTLAALREVREQVRELMEQEKAHKTETAAADRKKLPALAPKQGALKDKAQEAQQKTAVAAPEAARSLGDAAAQMQKAQTALASSKNNPEAQQASIDALQQADQQLGQEITKLEQAQKDLAKLEALQEKVEGVIQDQQKTQFNTAKASAAKPDAQNLKELSGKQDRLKKDTGQLQQEANAPAPTAAAHLGDAQQDMAQAKAELDKPSARTAQPRQSDALSDLYAAKKEIDKKANELRELLGLPIDPGQSLAEAQAAIEKAQQEVNESLAEMQQGPPGLMEALQQRQQQIADALGQKTQGVQTTSPLSKAQEAAGEAARDLARSDLPAALQSMQAAQDAMKQATPAANDSQSGQPASLAQQGPPGQTGQGQPPGKSEPTIPQLSREQAEVKKAAEALMGAMQSTPASAMQQAGQHLEQAGGAVGPVTAGKMGAMPQTAQSALQSAEQAMAKGAAQAASQEAPNAQASAAAASQALAQAQAALALAQAGLGSQPGQQGQQGKPGQQGQQPGQGQAQGQGQGQGQANAQNQGNQPGQGTPSTRGDGNKGNWTGTGGAQGARQGTEGTSGFLNLPKRDRDAIQQSQGEKYPQEYGPLVEQYLKNLSDDSGKK